nr:hypothetical protein [Bradyrhizobium sp. 2S1]MCK7667575.1 hypothetical protein [Bradyrhizobium sp. 2S1]
MNRQQRRRAEARARKGTLVYQHRLATAFQSFDVVNEFRRRVVRAVVEHDDWCAIYTARHACSCTPNVSLIPFEGGDGIYVVDEQGQAHRASRQ